MTTATAPTDSPALTAARLAQKVYVRHTGYCLAFELRHACRTCRELEINASAAYARVDAGR